MVGEWGSPATPRYTSASNRSSTSSKSEEEGVQKPDTSNIEEAELSLREQSSLNNEVSKLWK